MPAISHGADSGFADCPPSIALNSFSEQWQGARIVMPAISHGADSRPTYGSVIVIYSTITKQGQCVRVFRPFCGERFYCHTSNVPVSVDCCAVLK